MAQIDWGIIVSLCSLAIMVYTTIVTNAKSEERTQSEIRLVKKDVEHLSARVEKHNGVIERTYALEQKTAVMDEEIKVEQHRTSDLENDVKKINDRMTRRTSV